MTKDDIIRMARKVGMEFQGGFVRIVECVTQSELERFAALVAAAERERIADEAKHIIKRAEARGAAAEREACAKVCEVNRYEGYVPPEDGAAADYYNDASRECAAAIRARGQQ